MIVVARFSYAPDCVLSVVSVASTQFECYGLELPWLENRRGKSCIPLGIYEARVGTHWTDHATAPSVELLAVPGRTQIEIHAANRPSELLGCLALGMRLGALSRERAVLDSRVAMARLFLALLEAGAPAAGAHPALGAPVRVSVQDHLTRFRHYPRLAGIDPA